MDLPPPSPRPAAETAAPDLWVLGSFGMTGSVLLRHTAETVASALAAGAGVETLSFHPNAFAERDIVQSLAHHPGRRPMGIVYLRSLTRLTGSQGRVRRWWSRWRHLRRLIRNTDRVLLIREPRVMLWQTARVQRLLAWMMTLSTRNTQVVLATVAPATLLTAHLGHAAAPVSAHQAEQDVLAHIRGRSAAALRLTDAHVQRALDHPSSAAMPLPVRDDITALTRAARRIPPADLETALSLGRLSVGKDAPTALRAAFAASEKQPELTRIAEHLRLLGKPRRQWRQYLSPPARKSWPGTGLQSVILRHLSGTATLADVDALIELRRPLYPGNSSLSRLDWVVIVALRLPLTSMQSLLAPWACDHLAARLAELTPSRLQPRQTAPTLHLAGIAGNGTGLAQNYWMSAQALTRAGFTPDLRPSDLAPDTLHTLPAPRRSGPEVRLTRDVTLYHLNADRIPQEILAHDGTRDAYRIGYLLWELDRLPPAHMLALEMLDEIWVPSVFLKRLYQRHFKGSVVLMRKGITLPTARPWPAAPDGVSRFVMCFDQRSSVARKNPLAAVHAFRRAFAAHEPVELVIKTTPAPPDHWGDPEGQMAEIAALASRDPRIRLISEQMPFDTLLGLIGSASALLSPHRAEGFGYFPAFALGMGVPVIATDYSGPRDFCTEQTSYPIPFTFQDVPDSQAVFRTPGARWAEISQDDFARALQQVVRNPAAARARAERGRLNLQTDYTLEGLADRYLDRLLRTGLATRAAPAEEVLSPAGT